MAKSYGGVRALAGVDIDVHPGQVHAIVGENGAGKSTLMKILAGAERADSGTVVLDGMPYDPGNVTEARRAGVAIVFQELSLYPELDALANIFLLHEPRRFGLVDRREMRRLAAPVLKEIGLDIRLDATVKTLTLGERQLLEIARALLVDARLLILDEPNSALNARESEHLFSVVRRLRDRGVAVLYISHRLEEVFALSDVITVMRNGAVVGSFDPGASSIREVVAAMLGREPSATEMTTPHDRGEGSGLSFAGVSIPGNLHDVTFAVAPGEVLGIAGLEGSGVRAVFEAAFGIRPPDEGRVTLPDGRQGARTVPEAVRRGVAMVPSDRRNAGVMLDEAIAVNVAHVSAGALGRRGFLLRDRVLARYAKVAVERLAVKTPSVWTRAGQLSGGNQQKVVLAKWLDADPALVLLEDPTRGVDVGAKREIYDIVRSLAADGRVVVFSSSELQEYAYVCDRALVFYKGAIAVEVSAADMNEHRLLEAINTGT